MLTSIARSALAAERRPVRRALGPVAAVAAFALVAGCAAHTASSSTGACPPGATCARSGDLAGCWRAALDRAPALAPGRIEVAWVVADERVVAGTPQVVADTVGDSQLSACVLERIAAWRFPPNVEGAMSYPFLFQQEH